MGRALTVDTPCRLSKAPSECRRDDPSCAGCPLIEAPWRILDDCRTLGRPCRIFDCPYNLFHPHGRPDCASRLAREIKNCVLKIPEAETFGLEVIAEAWGVSAQAVHKLEGRAIVKFRSRISGIDPELFSPREREVIAAMAEHVAANRERRLLRWAERR